MTHQEKVHKKVDPVSGTAVFPYNSVSIETILQCLGRKPDPEYYTNVERNQLLSEKGEIFSRDNYWLQKYFGQYFWIICMSLQTKR